MLSKSKSKIVIGFYLFLVALSLAFMIADDHDSFSGLPAIVVTLPSSLIFFFITEIFHSNSYDSIVPGIVMVLISAAINSFCLFYLLTSKKHF
jgi:hypothetical protein